MCLIRDMIKSPSKLTKANLAEVTFNYRASLRQSHMVVEQYMLILQEPLGSGPDSFCRLRVVLPLLRNALFICFHANPSDGHLNAYRTHTKLRLRY